MKGISTLLALALLACGAFAQLPFQAGNDAFKTGFGSAVATFGPFTAVSSQGIVSFYYFNGTHAVLSGYVASPSNHEYFGASVSLAMADQTNLQIAVGSPSATNLYDGHVYLYTLSLVNYQITDNGNLTDAVSGDKQQFGAKVAYSLSALTTPVNVAGLWLSVSNPGSDTVFVFDLVTSTNLVWFTENTGFGSTLTGFIGYPIVLAASPDDSQGGTVVAYSLNTTTHKFGAVATVPNTSPTALKNFGYALAVTIDSAAFSIATKAVVAISTSNGFVVVLSCGLSFTCTPIGQLTYPGSGTGVPAFGTSLAAGNGYLYVGAYNVTHSTNYDGEIFPYIISGTTITRQSAWVAPGSKYLGKVLSANMGSPIVVAGADTSATSPYVYLFGYNSTVPLPTTVAPTAAPTTAAPTTHSGAALNTASFLLVALFLLAHFF